MQRGVASCGRTSRERASSEAAQIGDCVTGAAMPGPGVGWYRSYATWAYLARLYATVQPARLGYIRCHREPRRVMLLVEAVQMEYERASLRSVVKTAVRLATNGALPTYEGARCRRTEFWRRCLAAMNVITPGPQPAVTEAVWQQLMAIIGGQEETKGCQHKACKGMKTCWIVCQPGLSRCTRCKMPKSYGRTWKSVRDLVGLRPLA